MKIESRYIDGSYLAENPEWDRMDASWKAAKIHGILSQNHINPISIVEVGCGSGDILIHLSTLYPDSTMAGFDISPQTTKFWQEHEKLEPVKSGKISFHLGDFHSINTKKYETLLMLDVFEHVRDPFTFLEESRDHATFFVFHIPLDLSASSIIRKKALLRNRTKVGHLHFYTKDLAIETITDSGFQIIDCRYTGASLNMPNRKLKTRLAGIPRRLLFSIAKDLGVRMFGGETLMVLATIEQNVA